MRSLVLFALTLLCCAPRAVQAIGNFDGEIDQSSGPHECERPCEQGGAPRTCRYHLYVEWMVTMSKACYNCPYNLTDCSRPNCVAADGQRRQFIAVNRQLPGPKIEVCEGDTIEATISNRLSDGRVMTFHWHGQAQAETPWMDGVPYVTQCPILPGEDFTYSFRAYPGGTYMYHSHVGLDTSDGVFGSLIVKQPLASDPNSRLYDHDCRTPSGDCEHVVLLTDWTVGEAWGDYLMARWHSGASEFIKSGLLNGKNKGAAAPNPTRPDQPEAFTPYEVLRVQRNKRYRFRAINLASTECRYRISVHGHSLSVVATDGFPVRPFLVDAVTLFPGERFDFVVNTTQVPGNYWLQGWPIGECGETAAVYAVLRYDGVPAEEPAEKRDVFNFESHLNPIIEESDGDWGSIPGEVRVSELRGYESVPDRPADVTFYIGMDEFTNNGAFNHPRYYSYDELEELFVPDTAVFNNITFTFPKSPVLYQYRDVNDSIYCDQFNTNQDQCYQKRCHCTHRILVPRGALVEMVLVNEMKGEGAEGHPVHLHGEHFAVVGMAKLRIPLDKWDLKRMNDAGQLPKNFIDPPFKDTVQITGGGYAIIRFRPKPGTWLVHCHIQWHRQDGQALIMQVGDTWDFPKPPEDFPTCGAYPRRGESSGAEKGAPAPLSVLLLLSAFLFAW